MLKYWFAKRCSVELFRIEIVDFTSSLGHSSSHHCAHVQIMCDLSPCGFGLNNSVGVMSAL